MSIIKAIDLGDAKFGPLVSFDTRQDGLCVFTFKRREHPHPDKPYMTILYHENGGFFSGHYDLTRDEANQDFQNRIS